MNNKHIPPFIPGISTGKRDIPYPVKERYGVPQPPPFMSPIAPPGMCKPHHTIPHMNHTEHRNKYFYTVLFLDNYYHTSKNTNYPVITPPYKKSRGGELKIFEICQDSDSANVKWIDETKLYVRHNLPMPITVQMWDNEHQPLLYYPILKDGVDNITYGDVKVESQRALIFDFKDLKKPQYNEIYKLSIRSLPDFSLNPEQNDDLAVNLADVMEIPQTPTQGLAIIFRRNSLDGLYDLIAEFDQAYYHSMDQTSELKYLTEKSCYKDLHFATKYTNNLQDVMDLIDVNYYNVQYSWEDHKKYRG